MNLQRAALTIGLIASSLIIIKVFIDLSDRKKRLEEENALEKEIQKVEKEVEGE